METSLKTGFAQIYSCCPKNLSCPKFGGLQPPSPPRPVRLCQDCALAEPGDCLLFFLGDQKISVFCIEMGTLDFRGSEYFQGSLQVSLEHSLEDAFCLPLLETYVPSCSLHSATSPNPSLPPMGTEFFICGPQTLEQPAGKYQNNAYESLRFL